MNNSIISARVTQAERDCITHLADAAHLTLSEYLRAVLFSKTTDRPSLSALYLKTGETYCLAQVIQNQLSQTGEVPTDDFADLMAMIQEISAIAQRMLE